MAASADNSAATAAAAGPAGSTLPAELKAQFDEQIKLTAIRIPKQNTSQYMKLLSKWVVCASWALVDERQQQQARPGSPLPCRAAAGTCSTSRD